MVKDRKGNDLRERDVIRLDMNASHITGTIQELRVVPRSRGPARGFMRVSFQYEVPFDPEESIPEAVKIGSPGGDYGEAVATRRKVIRAESKQKAAAKRA